MSMAHNANGINERVNAFLTMQQSDEAGFNTRPFHVRLIPGASPGAAFLIGFITELTDGLNLCASDNDPRTNLPHIGILAKGSGIFAEEGPPLHSDTRLSDVPMGQEVIRARRILPNEPDHAVVPINQLRMGDSTWRRAVDGASALALIRTFTSYRTVLPWSDFPPHTWQGLAFQPLISPSSTNNDPLAVVSRSRHLSALHTAPERSTWLLINPRDFPAPDGIRVYFEFDEAYARHLERKWERYKLHRLGRGPGLFTCSRVAFIRLCASLRTLHPTATTFNRRSTVYSVD